MDTSQSVETFWMLLSLLVLPVDKQIEIISDLPEQGDPLAYDYSRNPASHLLSTMFEYWSGWLDEFYPDCPSAQKLYDAINGGMDFKMSRQGFIKGEQWVELRRLAKLSLEEAGLGPFPVPEKIDFNHYIEIT